MAVHAYNQCNHQSQQQNLPYAAAVPNMYHALPTQMGPTAAPQQMHPTYAAPINLAGQPYNSYLFGYPMRQFVSQTQPVGEVYQPDAMTGTPVNVTRGAVTTSCRGVFISNLNHSTTSDRLKSFLTAAGPVDRCEIKQTREGLSKGTATAMFRTSQAAKKAVDMFNGKRFMGFRITVKMDKEAAHAQVPKPKRASPPVTAPAPSAQPAEPEKETKDTEDTQQPLVVNGSKAKLPYDPDSVAEDCNGKSCAHGLSSPSLWTLTESGARGQTTKPTIVASI